GLTSSRADGCGRPLGHLPTGQLSRPEDTTPGSPNLRAITIEALFAIGARSRGGQLAKGTGVATRSVVASFRPGAQRRSRSRLAWHVTQRAACGLASSRPSGTPAPQSTQVP